MQYFINTSIASTVTREEIFLKFYLKRFNVVNKFNAIIQIVPQLYCTEME
jgi:hypothetical protein